MKAETVRKRLIGLAAGILSMVLLLIIMPPITASAEGNTGLGYEEADGNWYYYVDGAVDYDHTGLVPNENGWWLVRNGMIDFGYTGLWEDPDYGWWLVGGGRVVFEYTGLWNDPVYGWWLINEGTVAFDHTGLWNDPNCGWWLVGGGRVVFEYNGLWNDPTYGWWLVRGGTVAFDYTALWDDPNCGWWLVGGGSVAFGYNGLWNDPNCGWWLVQGGTVSFGYTGLWNDPSCGWWLIRGGTVAFDYTGAWNDATYGNWMISGGCVTGPVSGDTGSGGTDTGSGDTGSGSTDTGSGDTGSGGTDTGSGDTGSGGMDTGSGDPGSGGTDPGSGSTDTGSGDTGSGSTDTGSGDTGSGSTDTGSGDTGSGDTGSGGTGTGSIQFAYKPGDEFYKYEYAYKTGDTSGLSEADMKFFDRLKECLDGASGSDYEKELAVHDWLALNCAYDYDNLLNNSVPFSSFTPSGPFVYGTAVCQGYAEAFELCMDILGINCIMVTGYGNGGGHAWNAVQLDGEWYMVDVTWDDPVPDEPGYVGHAYFNVTDAQLRRDHEYTSEVSANGTKYYYYANVENYFTDIDAYYEYVNRKADTIASGETVSAVVELMDGSDFYDETVRNAYMDFSRTNHVFRGVTSSGGSYMRTITWTKR